MPDFTNPYDAYMGGKSQSQVMAKERADRLLAEIVANNKQREIDSGLADADIMRKLKQAELDSLPEKNRVESLKAQAYADQVAAQAEALKRGKPFDEARAQELQTQNLYGPLSAIHHMARSDVGGAAAAYDKIADQLPPSIRAVLESQQPSGFPGGYQSRFKPDSMGELLKAFNRSKSVTQLEKQGMVGDQSNTNNIRDNQTRITVAEINANAKRAAEELKAGNKGAMKTFEQYIVSLISSGQMDFQQGMQYVESVKAAAANASAAQDKPQVDLRELGVPTITPRQEGQRNSQPQLNMPQGWSVTQ